MLSDPPLWVKEIKGLDQYSEYEVNELKLKNNYFSWALVKFERYKKEIEFMPIIECKSVENCVLNNNKQWYEMIEIDRDTQNRI